MHHVRTILLAGTALLARPAFAADALKFGPPPAWVRAQAIPAAKASDAPLSLLLQDEQFAFEPGKITKYNEGAIKIQNSQGLAAGNLSIVWQPSTDTVTVNKLHIIRGGKVIDVLAGGQTFTVLRRETNLDAATLDGTLTATIQPEGLQEGDIIDLATTTERSDPVLKGHVEAMFGAWDGLPIQLAHARLNWPSTLHMDVRQTPNLPAGQKSSVNGTSSLELSAQNVEPLVPPKGAPGRFLIGRLAEASDFASWADLAELMIPLFRDASVIPSSGPLHDEVEKIRSSTSDLKARATQALALVQDRVRYVALLMGQGGYVPAPAEQTWSRRFGDCKAKTALLLGILRSLGIEAEPVLVQSKLGDMIADRLPMIELFNHVLVRAHVGGKDYWLDGTRTGDTDLDSIEIPDFGWGLPLVQHAELVHMVPKPLSLPSIERRVDIDATAGVYAPAPIKIVEIYRGDTAVALNTLYSAAGQDQRDEGMRDEAKSYFDDFTVASSSLRFDKATRELKLSISGTARLNWKDGWFFVPTSSVGFDPDFDRSAGALHDAPLAVTHPRFEKDVASIRLPHGFAAEQKLSAPVNETLAGVEYSRRESVSGDVLTVDSSERSLVPEVPYKDALAAAPQLRTLDKDDVYLNVPGPYAPTPQDVAALKGSKPGSANDYFVRAGAELANNDNDAALADFTQGLALDPENAWALGKRAAIFADKSDFVAAEKDIAAAEAIDGASTDNLRIRGYLAEKKHDFAAAADWYSKVLEKAASDSYALSHRAFIYVKLGKLDAALADINASIALQPRDAPLLARRALLYMMKHDLPAAHKDLEAAIKIDPKAAEVISAGAALASQEGDKQATVDMYTAAIKKDPKNGSLFQSRAKAYLAANEREKALADTETALSLGDRDPNLRLLRANLFAVRGDHAAVSREAEALMNENPNDEFAFIAAGKSLAAIGERDKALAALDKAVAIHPYAYVYLNRSQVRPWSDVAGRMADLDAALKVEPGNEDVLVEKARLLARSGDYKAALATIDLVKPDATDHYADLERGIILYKAGRTEEATKLLDTVRASSKTANELNSLCWEQATADIKLEAALQDCQAAVKLQPDAGQYEDSLGMVLLKMGKLDEALQAYDKAVADNTGAASLMGRAFVYLRKGDHARAEADAAAARKLSALIDDDFAAYGLKWVDASPAAKKDSSTASK